MTNLILSMLFMLVYILDPGFYPICILGNGKTVSWLGGPPHVE